jgi:hypothetical protein
MGATTRGAALGCVAVLLVDAPNPAVLLELHAQHNSVMPSTTLGSPHLGCRRILAA